MNSSAHLRHSLDLDLRPVEWTRAHAESALSHDCVEHGTLTHPDGETYVALRPHGAPDAAVVIFTTDEWATFTTAFDDGDFARPAEYEEATRMAG